MIWIVFVLTLFYQCLHKKHSPDTCYEYVADIKLTLGKNQ